MALFVMEIVHYFHRVTLIAEVIFKQLFIRTTV